jgi:hypothetical protein
MANLTLSAGSTVLSLPIYNSGETITYEFITLPQTNSQAGIFFPPVISNQSFANDKRILNCTIESLTETQKDELVSFYKLVEAKKNFSLSATNDKENVYDFTSIFSEEPEFTEVDINYWNVQLKFKEQ